MLAPARTPPRVDATGAIVRSCLHRGKRGAFRIQAAIQAVHTDAGVAAVTDWNPIVALYDQLLHFRPTPVVAPNRAIALAERDGPAAGLTVVDALGLDGYHLAHAARADLFERPGRHGEALDAYNRAIALTANRIEVASLTERRHRVAARVGTPATPFAPPTGVPE